MINRIAVLLISHLSSVERSDLQAFNCIYNILTDGLSIQVEQNKNTYSWSTSFFLIIIYSGTIISFSLFIFHFLFFIAHI